jgi:hypothetical protein
MNADLLDLAEHFRDMTDDELMSRCSSGSLTEVAQSVASAELAVRGLAMPGPITAEHETALDAGGLQTVARFLNPTDAHIISACLEGTGVPSIVADANLVQMNSLWSIALGGVRVLVPASRVAEANDVIEAFNRGDLALPDDGGF